MKNHLRRWLSTLGASMPTIILHVTVLSIVLSCAQALELSPAETISYILTLYCLPMAIGLAMALSFRQPLLMTGNIFLIIFVASLGGQLTYPEIVGASALAGIGVVLISLFGLTRLIAAWIPAPIVMGLLAGAVMPFVMDVFAYMGSNPILVGGTVLAYFLSRRISPAVVPPVLPALAVGLAIVALTGQFGQVAANLEWPIPVFTQPVFSIRAIATVTPVVIVLVILQTNLPSLVFLQSQGYEPPVRLIYVVSGMAVALGSLFGPTGVSLSLPATALLAGPAAGDLQLRYRAAAFASFVGFVIGLIAGLAADLQQIIPLPLMYTLAGLSLVEVFAGAIKQIAAGPLVLGPLFAFIIALSQMSLLGFGSFFWALVLGMGISLLLERDKLKLLRGPAELSATTN